MEEKANVEILKFSLELFKNVFKGQENILVSPISLLSALALAQLGASGETLEQIEAVTRMNAADLIEFLRTVYQEKEEIIYDSINRKGNSGAVVFPAILQILRNRFDGDKDEEDHQSLRCANSVWLNDDGRVRLNPSYRAECDRMPFAEFHISAFSDDTRRKVNEWVKIATAGEISKILDELSKDTVCLLINALTFDGKWCSAYSKEAVRQHVFHAADGNEMNVDFMTSEEKLYLRTPKAEGVIKPYNNQRYAFVALLPAEGVKLEDYIFSLSAEEVAMTINKPIKHPICLKLPKFTAEETLDLKAPLQKMGVDDAFSVANADFSKIGVPTQNDYNIFISDIRQKNRIRVDEEGTKAISVTTLDTRCMVSCITTEPYRLFLDRPFFYMIYDCKANVPIFIGTVNKIDSSNRC